MKRIRALVVDDEPLARRGVGQMLAAHPEVEIVGEAGSAATAIKEVRALRPAPASPAREPRLVIPGAGGLTVLDASEIDAVEADDYYSAIRARGRRFLLRGGLSVPVSRRRMAAVEQALRDWG